MHYILEVNALYLAFIAMSECPQMSNHHFLNFQNTRPRPEVIKKFMLNSAEHEIDPAHKC